MPSNCYGEHTKAQLEGVSSTPQEIWLPEFIQQEKEIRKWDICKTTNKNNIYFKISSIYCYKCH